MRIGIVSAVSSTPTPDLKVSAHPSMFTSPDSLGCEFGYKFHP
jgi:hypothetical protein